jgi:branched-chain amino acid aminotransferase
VNLDGKIVPPEEAKVSIFDRSFLFGDSVYETLRTYGGRPFALPRHLDRLEASAGRLRVGLPPRGEIERRVMETLGAAANDESYVRVVVSRGETGFGLGAGIDAPGRVYVIVRPYEPPPPEALAKGIAVVVARTRRNPPSALDPAIKTGNYLNSILAMIEAKDAGADDAVLLNLDGFVTEATTSTLFAVLGGVLVTAPLSAGILEGVTRHYALIAAKDAGLTVAVRDFTAAELRAAEEAFLASTLKEVLPIRTIDGQPTKRPAPGPVTARMREALSKTIAAAHAAG